MLRYKNKGSIIEIKIPTEQGVYAVECRYIYDKTKDKYALSMWLKRNNIDDKFKIDSQEIDIQYIDGTRETIKHNICRIVEQANISRFFEPYIKRFEYTYKCFDKGNEYFEQERLQENINV